MQRFFGRLKASQQRWAMYLYPLILVLLEILMKSLLSIEAGTVIGPSLAAVGAGFAIPLTVKKPLSIKKLKGLKQKMKPSVYNQLAPMYTNGTIHYTDDEEEQVRNIGYSATLILTGCWAITLVLTIKPPAWWAVYLTVVLGVVSCGVGLALIEWSEGKN
jgi:hypothetical protein